MIEGLSVCDRMSFYFKSRYALRALGSAVVQSSDDWEQDCRSAPEVPAVAGSSSGGGAFSQLSLIVLVLLLGLRGASRRRYLRQVLSSER